VVAHLDPGRRAALHGELADLGAQVFMTGADPALFAEVKADPAADVLFVEVVAGRLEPRGRA
jgi:DNA replication and repair protein RecF